VPEWCGPAPTKELAMSKSAVVVVTVITVIVACIVIFLFMMGSYGPKLEEVKYLLEPRIITKENTNALVVEATGDPSNTVGPAFGLLFKAYFKLKDAPKGKKMACPMARWPRPLETPKDQWLGIYGMPVPESVREVPPVKSGKGLTVELREWSYGEVAEILHVGPYASEDTTVNKLKSFIDEQGYDICGPHEEEYLKGPSFIPTNPEKYLTIIRYQVCRKLPAPAVKDSTETETM
jgi:hypothetical protein